MSRTIESMLSPGEARSRIFGLAEPVEAIEVSLIDALGLVLAEPVQADVDLPPFDRASCEGYAVRAAEATPGALLRVIGTRRIKGGRRGDRGRRGQPGRRRRPAPRRGRRGGPPRRRPARPRGGADPRHRGPPRRRPWPRPGPPGLDPGGRRRGPRRGDPASALDGGAARLAGVRPPVLPPPVRVAILAVGDDLVPPADAPTMHRERNAGQPRPRRPGRPRRRDAARPPGRLAPAS